MKPGQRLTRWWQQYVLGRLRTPQAIVAAARAENPDKIEDRFTEVPVDNKEWDTPKRLRAEAFLNSQTYANQQQRADWQQCDHRMRARCPHRSAGAWSGDPAVCAFCVPHEGGTG